MSETGRGEYLKLCAILDATKEMRSNWLYPEVVTEPSGGMLLRVHDQTKVLASAPFDPSCPDEAALDIARQLTIPGANPLEDY